MSLAVRAIAEEQMDDPALPEADYAALLGDLAQVNRWTQAARPTLAFLARIARPGDTLRLLDVGFGHGDMLRAIANWAARRDVRAELVGIDLNPRSAAVARDATPAALPITFCTGDYADLAAEPWDAIVSSLVAHHMSREQLVAFVRFMERHARRGWFVNDLRRSRVSHLGYPLLARAMRWHRIVREDGTLSIARSYRAPEWRPILEEAGVSEAEILRVFPFRLCIRRLR